MWKFFLFFYCFQVSLCAAPLKIVGSSTVFPFAATVAEHFHKKSNEPTPIVESTGTGAGIKLFCGSPKAPDIVMASRPMTKGEAESCRSHNVTFEEVKIGKDGLVIFQNKQDESFSLTLADLSLALNEKIKVHKTCIKNPYKTWKDVASHLPDQPIHVLGPAPTSGTYDVLIENLIQTCGPYLRHDGSYVEAPTNENLIIQKIISSSDSVGIVTFSYFENNKDKLRAISINSTLPTLESIQKGNYALARDLFIYIKTNDGEQNPARRLYRDEFTSPSAVGKDGYLKTKGLIPLAIQ